MAEDQICETDRAERWNELEYSLTNGSLVSHDSGGGRYEHTGFLCQADHSKPCNPDAITHRYNRMCARLGIDTNWSSDRLRGRCLGDRRAVAQPAARLERLQRVVVGVRPPRADLPVAPGSAEGPSPSSDQNS
jgi:hypothetical protein